MPVKLVATDDPNNSMVITLSDYKQGRTNFSNHYFLANCDTNLGGQDLRVLWADFYNAVNGYITTNAIDPTTVALRFVYAFNPKTASLTLRMQICTMKPSPEADNVFLLITDPCAWYKLDEEVTEANDKSTADPDYLRNLYYCEADTCDANTCENLAVEKPDTKYARTATFPWAMEILQMYTDNKSPEDGYICFGACSYVNGGSGDAPIMYPHGTVIYMEDSKGTPLLNDDDTIVLFNNKGCDMATLCPSNCDVYIVPAATIECK